MDREKAIEVLRLSEPMQKTHSLMETAICIAKRESYLTDEEEATLREAVELAIKALEQTRWIACSDRLPEKNDIYVVWTSKGFGDHLSTSYYNTEDGWTIEVCAWKENGGPYKGESEGEYGNIRNHDRNESKKDYCRIKGSRASLE